MITMKLAVITILFFGVSHTSSMKLPGRIFSHWAIPIHSSSPEQKTETKIENKNINVVVSLDPKTVASELMKLIEERTGQPQTRRTLETYQRMEDIENLITPILIGTKRSKDAPSAFELASSLDHITRQAITKDPSKPPTIDDEIATRDVVSRMMKTLKVLTEEKSKIANLEESEKSRRTLGATNDLTQRRLAESTESDESDDDDDDDDDDLVTLEIQVPRTTLKQAIA